jgi:hypothetical protein
MATKVIKARIQILSKTAAQLAAENPVLLLGEPSRETDTGVEKIGDGVTAYIDLPVKPGSVDGADGADGVDGNDGVDGLSAYQIAVANGFVGNEAAWLVSLQGDDGAAASIGDVGGLTEALDDRMRGTVRLTVSAIPPASPSVNDLWIETS